MKIRCPFFVPVFLVVLFAVGTLVQAQASLRHIWQDDTGGTAYDIEVWEGWVYVSNNVGVSIYDARIPDQPHSLHYGDGFIHVANMIDGYVLLRLDYRPPPRRPGGRQRPISSAGVQL